LLIEQVQETVLDFKLRENNTLDEVSGDYWNSKARKLIRDSVPVEVYNPLCFSRKIQHLIF
jgi:hypothetical protein